MTIQREFVFDEREFETRYRKVRLKMAQLGIDTLLLHSAPNIYYMCGHHTLNLWDYQCLIVPLEKSPVMLLWQFERGRFEASASHSVDLELYETHADPVESTWLLLKKRGLLTGTVAIESSTRYLVPDVYARLQSALNETRVVSGSGIVANVRNIKSETELDMIRSAAKITDQSVIAGISAIREGVTDSEVAATVAGELIRNHSLGFSVYPIVSAGYRAGIPHNSNCGHAISVGETVFIECSPSWHWYHAPLMRTAVLGEASDQVEKFANLEQQIVSSMLEYVRSGVLASDVALIAESWIKPIRNKILFHEVYGYPVGIGFPPTWGEESGFAIVTNNHRQLEAGMVFHIPMTLRINGETGVGLSQTFIVNENGAEVLSELPMELYRVEL